MSTLALVIAAVVVAWWLVCAVTLGVVLLAALYRWSTLQRDARVVRTLSRVLEF